MLMAKRFGKISGYQDWLQPKLVSNAIELLDKEIPRYKNKIKFVQLCFTTDPFMYNYPEISDMSCRIIKRLNKDGIKCTALTKGVLPSELAKLSKDNEYGITLITINDTYRKNLEPYASPMEERINGLKTLHNKGFKTWVSIEPYPTPNIINQNLEEILEELSFVDKIIFGRLNYNTKVTDYKGYHDFFNRMAETVIEFAIKNKKEYHIKKGTMTQKSVSYKKASNVEILV